MGRTMDILKYDRIWHRCLKKIQMYFLKHHNTVATLENFQFFFSATTKRKKNGEEKSILTEIFIYYRLFTATSLTSQPALPPGTLTINCHAGTVLYTRQCLPLHITCGLKCFRKFILSWNLNIKTMRCMYVYRDKHLWECWATKSHFIITYLNAHNISWSISP